MFQNLKTEMARSGVSRADLAEKLGVKYLTLSKKINGENDFKLGECLAIKEALNSPLPIEELFAKEQQANG